MVDLIQECLADPFFAKFSGDPESLKANVCSGCKAARCVNAQGKFTLFEKRVSTQVDRLLTNPKFADPRDPRFKQISAVDFPDMARHAVALEITTRKNDWSIPTEDEVSELTEDLAEATPLHFQTEDLPTGQWEVRGDSGKNYTVSVSKTGDWKCTCPSRVQPCKHVRDTALKLSRAPEEPPPAQVPAPTLPPSRPPPGPVFAPLNMNTSIPSEGILIGDATSRPKVDLWAAPAEKTQVIPVGGKVRFGTKK